MIILIMSIFMTPVSSQAFGSTLASIFSRGTNSGVVGGGGGQQQTSNAGMTGLRLMSSGSGGSGLQSQATFGRLQSVSGASISGGGTMGTRMPGVQSGRLQSSGSLFSGLADLFPGLGGGGGGGGGGFPALPPGMTLTQDGCICPVPKAKTKYIAVEVPKVIFVPPKEKTKIITIKEIVEKPASNYHKYDSHEDEEDGGVSFDDSSYR